MKRLEEIKKRVEAATPGRWTTFHPRFRYCANDICADDEKNEPFVLAQMNRNMPNWKEDADFIAHARTDIYDLLRVVEIQREALRRIATHANISSNHKKEYEGDSYSLILELAKQALALAREILGAK